MLNEFKREYGSIGNCIIWALKQIIFRGGFLVVRKSNYGWWPHFFWSIDLQAFYEYEPITPNEHLPFPPPFYRGFVREYTMDDALNYVPVPMWKKAPPPPRPQSETFGRGENI